MDRPTAIFEAQHAELVGMAKAVVRLLDTRTLEKDPTPVRRALAEFTGRLRVHAAMENDALYPRLLASTDPKVAGKARELYDEFGPLYREFFAFHKKWSDTEAIRREPDVFSRETMLVLHRLGQRMRKENAELYPLVTG